MEHEPVENKTMKKSMTSSFYNNADSTNVPSEVINHILNRTTVYNDILKLLSTFHEESANNPFFKKGFFVYGPPGSGKTHFVMQMLRENGYDPIRYNSGDVCNKTMFEHMTSHNISQYNVYDLLHGKHKKIVIVVDEIDGLNNGDKGGIMSLIKIIRQKKTKKQKKEERTMNPVICISNYCIEKKVRELMRVCHNFELKKPTSLQIEKLLVPFGVHVNKGREQAAVVDFIQGDLWKLVQTPLNLQFIIGTVATDTKQTLDDSEGYLSQKIFNENAKRTTHRLLNSVVRFHEHDTYMTETDRTVVGLHWHENIIDMLSPGDIDDVKLYSKMLSVSSYSDYIDRLTFQMQVWQFNEMSSLLKTFYCNKLFHDQHPEMIGKYKETEIRFTKCLTKWSSSFNNEKFLHNLSQSLGMDLGDMQTFFSWLNTQYENDMNKLESMLELFEIKRLDIKRIFRFLEKNFSRDETEETVDDGGESVDKGEL